MAHKLKTEHNGAKNGGGAWTCREDAKKLSNIKRRINDKVAIEERSTFDEESAIDEVNNVLRSIKAFSVDEGELVVEFKDSNDRFCIREFEKDTFTRKLMEFVKEYMING